MSYFSSKLPWAHSILTHPQQNPKSIIIHDTPCLMLSTHRFTFTFLYLTIHHLFLYLSEVLNVEKIWVVEGQIPSSPSRIAGRKGCGRNQELSDGGRGRGDGITCIKNKIKNCQSVLWGFCYCIGNCDVYIIYYWVSFLTNFQTKQNNLILCVYYYHYYAIMSSRTGESPVITWEAFMCERYLYKYNFGRFKV